MTVEALFRPETRSRKGAGLDGRRVGLHRHQAAGDPDCVGTAETIDRDGVRLHAAGDLLQQATLGRYVWLDLDLDGGEPVRALGEVMPQRSAVSTALDIRFKHLFPDHKQRLMRALGEDMGL